MRIKITEHQEFQNSIKAIRGLVGEAVFKFNSKEEMIELTSMDTANVCMIIFRFPSSKCEEWNVKEDFELGVNLANFSAYFKSLKGDASLVLSVGEDKARIKMQIEGKKSKKTFYLPIINIEEKQMKIPDLKFLTTVKVDSDILNEAIEDMDLVSESFSLKTKKGKFTVLGKGDLNTGEVEIIEAEVDGEAESKYSNEYMKKILKGAKISERTILKWSNEYPVEVKFVVDSGCYLKYILAPRVENS